MYGWVQRADAALAAVEQALVVLLTGGIVAIMMTQVVLRYVFNAPLFWAEEISVQLLVYVTAFGLALLTRQGSLVSIDFLPRALGPRARNALLAALGLLMLALLVFVAALAWDWVTRPEVRMELSPTTQLPRWYSYAVLPAGLACMACHQAAAVLRHLHALRGGEEAST